MYKALFSRKTIDKIPEYYDCVHDLLNTSAVQELGEYTHHKGTTRLQHSLNVSYYNFLLCRKLHFDACSAARDRKSTRLNSSHDRQSRMPSSA